METPNAILLTTEMTLLLTLIGVALVLFAFEWVAADVVALGAVGHLDSHGAVDTRASLCRLWQRHGLYLVGTLYPHRRAAADRGCRANWAHAAALHR